MIQSPHFRSHAEQQAVLGCAAALDPVKFPRRYAQFIAQGKNRPVTRGHGDKFRRERAELAEGIRELAATMTIDEAAETTGIDRKHLRLIADENGIVFPSKAALDRMRLAEIARSYLDN